MPEVCEHCKGEMMLVEVNVKGGETERIYECECCHERVYDTPPDPYDQWRDSLEEKEAE